MEKLEQLRGMIRERGRDGICLAFSGGVDSALLLRLAAESGLPLLAVTFQTALHPQADLEEAQRQARALGAEHLILRVDEFQNPNIMQNPPDRCYHCKYMLFEQLSQTARKRGLGCLMDGTNRDDLDEYRPGLRALRDWHVASPLAECGIRKAEVRAMARELGIAAAERPSAPCMATRFPYGQLLSREKLLQVERAEDALRTMGFYNIRVRSHQGIARIEVDLEALPRVLEQREAICRAVKGCGFDYVTLDLEGFRSGSMDVVLRHTDS